MSKSPISVTYQEFSARTHETSLDEKKFIKAQIELTYKCNLHCVHCYTDPYNRPDLIKKEMPYEDVCKVLDQLAEENIMWLCFTGGEIFMRKDFLRIYDYAYKKGFLITLFTNATLITDQIVEHFKSAPPFSIDITIYGATEETFDRVTTVKGSYRLFMEGIERLIKAQLPIKLKTAALTINQHEMSDMKELVENWGYELRFDVIMFPRLNGDLSSTKYRLKPEDAVNIEFEMGPYSQECKLTPEEVLDASKNIPNEASANMYRCGCGSLQTHIDPYGNVGACTWQRHDRFDFRQVRIIEGMRKISKTIENSFYTEDSACRDCVAHALCEKMPETAVHETDDVQKPIDYYCDVAFTRADRLKSVHQQVLGSNDQPNKGSKGDAK